MKDKIGLNYLTYLLLRIIIITLAMITEKESLIALTFIVFTIECLLTLPVFMMTLKDTPGDVLFVDETEFGAVKSYTRLITKTITVFIPVYFGLIFLPLLLALQLYMSEYSMKKIEMWIDAGVFSSRDNMY